ncbi:MAG TPA: hypothetical protein VF657_22900 [Actinoplanes sp.]|jgi:hypothetical protein
MRLILAHRYDVPAHELAARWGTDALLLHPDDLHTERLVLAVDTDGSARAEFTSRPHVTSVLSRLGGIGPAELHHVDPQDLAYAAAELDAFLRAWLLAWPGPVVNRPTVTSLNGPGWRPEQWAVAAAAVGLAVRTVTRPAPVAAGHVHAATPDPGAWPGTDAVQVVVVGNRWFGDVTEAVGRRLCALARATGCTLLESLVAADGTVLHVSASPDISAPHVAEALVPILDGRP